MARWAMLLLIAFLILTWSAYGLDYKKEARIDLLAKTPPEYRAAAPHFAASELCTVRNDAGGELMGVSHWLLGNELYKSYQNPGLSCDGPYPFTVEEIYMVLWFDYATTIYVSVDVESADVTNPGCPFPGDLLSLSSTYEVVIPGGGLYQVAVPLDSPAVVDEPYFVGFYFADDVDTLSGASPVTDQVPVPCVSYNIWDAEIGFVDLYDTGFPSFPQFPGRLLLYSSGIPGGFGGEEPEPSVTIIKPNYNEIVVEDIIIWAAETSGSNIIDYIKFDYRTDNGAWTEIGLDEDGSRAMRNGIDPSVPGDGFTMPWDYSGLTEGNYWLKATVYDTLGRSSVDSIPVSIDPTPPVPFCVNPAKTDTICLPETLEITTADEDVSLVKFESKAAAMDYEIPVVTLDQSPFGAHYCGPVTGAIAIRYWFDQGNIYCMREGAQYITIDTVAARLADNMLTDENNGTYDDLFYYGLQQYILTHGNELRLNAYRNPDYHDFRTLLQERELILILGLSGEPGLYLVGAGVAGLEDDQERYAIKVSDPLTGSIMDVYLRNTGGGAEVYYDGSWHNLDLIITVAGYTHTVTRDFIGADNNVSGGWTTEWNTYDIFQDSLYFMTATVTDAEGRSDMKTSMSLHRCQSVSDPGDFNDDGTVNVGDALYLIEYIYKDGPEPVGGPGRADANCDDNIDLNDIIFIIKYVLAEGDAPCY